jgi:hypothetical protein
VKYTVKVNSQSATKKNEREIMLFLWLSLYFILGSAFYFISDHFIYIGEMVNGIYAKAWMGTNSRLGTYAFICFVYGSAANYIYLGFLKKINLEWNFNVNPALIIYLTLRSLALLILCLLLLDLTAFSIDKLPYSEFHEYLAILVPCLLLGRWIWPARDIFFALSKYQKKKSK